MMYVQFKVVQLILKTLDASLQAVRNIHANS